MGMAVVAAWRGEAVTAQGKGGVRRDTDAHENDALAASVIGIGKLPVVALVAELVARLIGGGFQRRRPASVLRAAMPLRKEPLQKTLVTKIKAESFLPDGKKNRCAERTSLRSLLFKHR